MKQSLRSKSLNARKRASGALLHITSTPSPFGIGVLGSEAVEFAAKLASMGFSYWQILPISPIGAGDSPYDSTSAFGGNTLLIDPRSICARGLCTESEVGECVYGGSPYTADYAFAKASHEKLLRIAYSRETASDKAADEAFAASQPEASDYALFLALSEKLGGRWKDWGEYASAAAARAALKTDAPLRTAYGYHLFCQRVFSEDYADFKSKVNSTGIKILGDMPFYVSYDSCDCWSHTDCFDIDPVTYEPGLAAGVPPDYFSEDGQLWGNPVYNWASMKKDGYSWWRRRIKHSLSLFDTLRLDHFRAFASFWAVERQEKTARNGKWLKADGSELFKLVAEDCPGCDIIAEDLGVFGEDVQKLLTSTGFPGMKIIQFGFDPSADSTHLPHNCVRNSVAFVGTHDNNTLLGWLWEASEEERRFALSYCGYEGSEWGSGGYRAPACRKIIEAVWRSPSYLAIVPFQDMCGFGADARMNVPGVPEGNWRFRTTAETVNSVDLPYFCRLNKIFRR